jgi:hypothetical protein
LVRETHEGVDSNHTLRVCDERIDVDLEDVGAPGNEP